MFRLAAVLALIAPPALGETITFEAEDGDRLVRCRDFGGVEHNTLCEILFADEASRECVALDAEGEPIAIGGRPPGWPVVTYLDVRHEDIADVICRRN